MTSKIFNDGPSASGPVVRFGTIVKKTGVLSPERFSMPLDWHAIFLHPHNTYSSKN